MKLFRNLKRTYNMYKFFESARNPKAKQPPKIVKFYQLYKAVRTR